MIQTISPVTAEPDERAQEQPEPGDRAARQPVIGSGAVKPTISQISSAIADDRQDAGRDKPLVERPHDPVVGAELDEDRCRSPR